jgi:sugar phosphate isomerase/epimerase
MLHEGAETMFHDPQPITRRDALKQMGGAAVALAAMVASPASGSAQRARYQLGYGLYGMRSLPHMEGLGHIARIGYKHAEITLRPGWDTEPRLLNAASRAAIRRRISDLGLTLVDVMEGMQPASNASVTSNLERLRMAAEVAHECSPGAPALIQCPIGGRPNAWMERRKAMAEELAIWASKLDELDVTFCIKPHSKQAMGRPEELLWMLQQVNHPRMRGVYDYGHFMAFGLDLVTTIRQLGQHVGFIHIKDAVGMAPNHRFVLPGDGGVDYALFLKTMQEVGYQGPIVVEVSTDVFGQAGYDPVGTAQRVWDRLSPIFAA